MFPHKGIEIEMTMPLHGVHEVGQRRLEPFTVDAVGSLPDHDDRFAYVLVVDAPTHDLLALIVAGLTQQPDAVLAMVAGYRSEFVENPPFVFLGRLPVSVPDRCHKFLLGHLADASPHVAAARVFGNMLVEATTLVE